MKRFQFASDVGGSPSERGPFAPGNQGLRMTIAVDLLVLGGGVQGLALMKELSSDYSAVLVGTSPRVSESLHSHGYFSSGWNAANLEAARVYHQVAGSWRSFLDQNQIPSQHSSFYAALPEPAVAFLEPNWKKAGIAYQKVQFPQPFDLSRLPAHQTYQFSEDLVFDAAPVITLLQRPLAGALLEAVVTGVEVRNRVVTEVTVHAGEGSLTITPGYLLAACGAGNAALLKMMGVPGDQVARSQVVRPMHMILARGTPVPHFSGCFLDLLVIAHPLQDGETLWLITWA